MSHQQRQLGYVLPAAKGGRLHQQDMIAINLLKRKKFEARDEAELSR